MDLAWLNSFDYNYNNLAKQIFISITESLMKDKKRTFILSEVGFI